MTIQTTIAVPPSQVRSLDTGLFLQTFKPILPVTAQNDSQVIVVQRVNQRLLNAHLRVPATFGAGVVCTLWLRRIADGSAFAITAPTAPAAANVVSSIGICPVDMFAGDQIEVVVTGGPTAVADRIEIDLALQHL